MDNLDRFEKLARKAATPIPYSMLFGAGRPLKLVVSAGVHGDEQENITGMLQAIEELQSNLASAPYASFFLVGNPLAVIRHKRFCETDLNRVFGVLGSTYEHRRADQILAEVQGSQYLLDLHQTIEDTQRPFGIFPGHTDLIEFFRHISDISDVILTSSLSATAPSCLDEYAHHAWGACAITVETGATKDQSSATRAYHLIRQALAYAGVLPGRIVPNEKLSQWRQVQFVENEPQTRVHPGLVNMQDIAAGQPIAYRADETIKAAVDGRILFPKYVPTTDRYLVRVMQRA